MTPHGNTFKSKADLTHNTQHAYGGSVIDNTPGGPAGSRGLKTHPAVSLRSITQRLEYY